MTVPELHTLDERFLFVNGWLRVVDVDGQLLGLFKKGSESLLRKFPTFGGAVPEGVTSGEWALLPAWARAGITTRLAL